jgi:predicted alpha/beta-fold hydrolase
MPLVTSSEYKPIPWYFSGHIETIFPSVWRKVPGVSYTRSRLELSDGDFVDLDWLVNSETPAKKLVISSHGLEGNSTRHYCMGMAAYFHRHGWDALSWNCRSCSGELNRLPRFYHHGDTNDFGAVVDEAIGRGYDQIVLVGFSMGGSFSLKYAGEKGKHIHPSIKAVVGFSVPCDLSSSAAKVDQRNLWFYRDRFIGKLMTKIRLKATRFEHPVFKEASRPIKTFHEFNNIFTAGLHGFRDAADFYEQASCEPWLAKISVPALIVNAANDPMLTDPCYPFELARNHSNVYLEVPRRGGHVGFPLYKNPVN